jgi:hypothetical protein
VLQRCAVQDELISSLRSDLDTLKLPLTELVRSKTNLFLRLDLVERRQSEYLLGQGKKGSLHDVAEEIRKKQEEIRVKNMVKFGQEKARNDKEADRAAAEKGSGDSEHNRCLAKQERAQKDDKWESSSSKAQRAEKLREDGRSQTDERRQELNHCCRGSPNVVE